MTRVQRCRWCALREETEEPNVNSFWDFLWLIVVSFVFITYLLFLFSVIGDLVRDRETSGWVKALWVLFFVFVPFITALVYLIVRGPAMNRRSAEAAKRMELAERAYVREVAGTSPAHQISEAKALLDSGAIDETEYRTLKSRALAG